MIISRAKAILLILVVFNALMTAITGNIWFGVLGFGLLVVASQVR